MKSVFVARLAKDFLDSGEFMFCWEMLKKSLPPYIAVITLTKEDDNTDLTVSDILEAIGTGQDNYENVFISGKPAFLAAPGSFAALLTAIEAHTDIDCMLPYTMQSLPPDAMPGYPYYTLRGFERFSSAIKKGGLRSIEPHPVHDTMFLIRAKALTELPAATSVPDIISKLDPSRIRATTEAFIHSFSGYYSEDRSSAAALIPEGTSSLLDIGCACGDFGAYVKKHKGCRVVGIEMNENEAKIAGRKLDEVIAGDFNTIKITEIFDCVTCLDVLEHFIKPELLLQRAKTVLGKNGYLILSIPNIGHWSIIEDLLAGRWDYIPAGILCNTHVRFYTKDSISSLLNGLGFRIISITDQKSTVPEHMTRGFAAIRQSGIEIDEESCSCSGYYILAQKEEPSGSLV